ncbi:rho GDP-dissociation inhibitor 3 isoform X1 [Agelaius phoeniceus]|uniref:rho GDP-dissociation inhibitor 3 isoform X1 n=1 Tax=Agelaius phoeniceus TaxID=39638 RepID=UPI004054E58E
MTVRKCSRRRHRCSQLCHQARGHQARQPCLGSGRGPAWPPHGISPVTAQPPPAHRCLRVGGRGCPPGCPRSCHCLSPADIMADKEGVTLSLEEEEEDADVALAYKTPEKKSLREIQELDPGDESLRKYKQALLGAIPAAVDASVPNVQVTKLTLMCEQAPGPITMDLTGEPGDTWGGRRRRRRGRRKGYRADGSSACAGDLEELRGRAFVLKEGVDYRVKVSFKVNREIVCGLRCLHLTYRRGRPVDRDVFMVGSYAPRAEEYEVVTPAEEAPRGWLARGSYRVRSLVTDDDKTEHLCWEWGLCIKKAWED